MLKPLELTIYPLDPSFPAGYKLPRDTRITHRAANRMATEKRLTSAEVAAEYWRASSGADEVNYDRRFDEESINGILHRFATLPHYDEQDTP